MQSRLKEDDPLTGAVLLPTRVVVVEGDRDRASQMSDLIGRIGEGWEVTGVASAGECLSLLQRTTFGVAVVSQELPDMEGLEFVEELRRRGWSMGTVLVTTRGSEELAASALSLGVAGYVRTGPGFADKLVHELARVAVEQRRRLQEFSDSMRLQVQLAQRAQRGLLDCFAAPIVHDIKNPLSYIIGGGQLLHQKPDPDVRELAQFVLNGAQKIRGLVDRLIQFARQEMEERVPLDLGAFLSRLVASESVGLNQRNVRLVMNVPTGPVRVRAAPGGLEQVFLNLIGNAGEMLVRYRCGGTIQVDLSARAHHAIVRISDDGPGIPAAVLPRLFRPFATDGKGGGTGLGLSIAAGTVWEHGGQVSAANLPEGGAEFTVRLPLEQQGPRAVILEDEKAMRELEVDLLEELGIRSEVHADPASILESLPDAHWDLFLLDIRTPGQGGTRVLQEIILRRPDLLSRVIVVSGALSDRTLRDILASHPIPCLPKPFSVDEFYDVVRLALRVGQSV
ncbi:MAG: response regulator [Candidatus Riflebacteria bacterium]|nr:response regulator [Candidatus Riflebacteria bacterium]